MLAVTIAFSKGTFIRNSTARVQHATGTSMGMEMEQARFFNSTWVLVGSPPKGLMMAKARHALSERPKYYPSLFAFLAPQFQQPAQVEKSGRTQLFLANHIENLEGRLRSSNDYYMVEIAQQALNNEKIAFYCMTAYWRTLEQISFAHIKKEIPNISRERLHEIEQQYKISKTRAEGSLEKFNLVWSHRDQLLTFYIPFVWLTRMRHGSTVFSACY